MKKIEQIPTKGGTDVLSYENVLERIENEKTKGLFQAIYKNVKEVQNDNEGFWIERYKTSSGHILEEVKFRAPWGFISISQHCPAYGGGIMENNERIMNKINRVFLRFKKGNL